MRSRFLALAALAVALPLSALAQAPQPGPNPGTDLYGFVRSMGWNPATSGPLVAVVAFDGKRATSLQGLGRKTATVGGLTAIVPLSMTTIDTRFVKAPNLYDGLPQSDKTLYLLSTLTPGQWAKAGGESLTYGDLRGEQAAVFDSLLPDPFRYRKGTVLAGTSDIAISERPEDQRSIVGADRHGIRLRVVRHLSTILALRTENGFTGGDLDAARKPGTAVADVHDEPKGEFGHQVFATGPNVPRPSELDLRGDRLGAMVAFKPEESVGDLLARVSAATGLRLVADPHYVPLAVVEVGERASARDLLGAISLGVAGTFRRVGGAYVLTNDLEGMAAHQARIAAWEETIKSQVREWEVGWRAAITASGGLSKAGFWGAAYEGLSEAERANVEANDRVDNEKVTYLPIAGASRVLAESMRNYHGGNDIDRTRAALSSSVGLEFVLPDGSAMSWPLDLGQMSQFTVPQRGWTPPNPKPVPLPLAATPRLAGLLLHADAPAEAKALVARVARLGVGSLMLETESSEALAAAVAEGKAKGVKVGLAVRPWAIAPGTTRDPDRTATGLHGKALAAAKATLVPWTRYWAGESAYEPPTRERLGPLDPAIPARIRTVAGLAGTPGLASVALLDLYGPGYGKAYVGSYGYYSPALDGFIAYGYTDAGRIAHFEATGVDPLDLPNAGVRTDLDLHPAWLEGSYDRVDFASWQKARGTWAHAAALRLARALAAAAPTASILLPGQPPQGAIPPFGLAFLQAWNPKTELPVAPQDFLGDDTEKAADLEIAEIQDDRDPAGRGRVASLLQKRLTRPGKPLVLDLSSVPADRLETVLARWLKDRS